MATCCVFDYAKDVITKGSKGDKHSKKNKGSDDDDGFGKMKKFDDDFFGKSKKSACIFK